MSLSLYPPCLPSQLKLFTDRAKVQNFFDVCHFSDRFQFSLIFFTFASNFNRCEWILSVNDVTSWLAASPRRDSLPPSPAQGPFILRRKTQSHRQRPWLVPGPYRMNWLTSSEQTLRFYPALICSVSQQFSTPSKKYNDPTSISPSTSSSFLL